MPDEKPNGRPSDYSDAFLQAAKEYVQNYEAKGDAVPTIEGMAVELGKAVKTLYNWAETHDEFQDVLDALMAKQGRLLQNGGLSGKFQQPTTKRLLSANHDKREKTDNTQRNKDEVGLLSKLYDASHKKA